MKMYLKVMLIAMVCAVLNTGCSNTVQGFGKDMETGGQEIQKTVSSNK